MKPLLSAFSRSELAILAATAEGDRVAVEAKSDGELADGRPDHNEYHFLFVVRDGVIYQVKQYGDTYRPYPLLRLSGGALSVHRHPLPGDGGRVG